MNSNAIAFPHHGSFNKGIDSELLAQSPAPRGVVSLNCITDVLRDNTEASDHRQTPDHFLGHAVGKIFLRRIAGKVF